MKLLTYNFLTSKCIRGVKVGYPLKLHVSIYIFKNLNRFLLKICFVLLFSKQVVEKREVQADFSPEFITKTLPRLEWPAIYEAAQLVSYIKINKFGKIKIQYKKNSFLSRIAIMYNQF